MTPRQIKETLVQVTRFAESEVGADPIAWLVGQARAGMTLLAHADDGVIWGKATAQGFVAPPPQIHAQAALRTETLQMARLFDKAEEVFLWRIAEGKWRGRRIVEGVGQAYRYFDELQILWGTQVEAASADFGRVADGEQGMRHAPPVELQVQDWQGVRRLRLGLRHYLGEDDEGWLRVIMSRLTDVWKEALR